MLMERDAGSATGLSAQPSTVYEAMSLSAHTSPTRIALTDGSQTLSYGQLLEAVRGTAEMLVRLAVRPGDRVMLVCENGLEACVLYFALTAIDAWPVIVNARLSDREVDAIFDHCGARRIICTTAASVRAKAHATRHGAVAVDLPFGGEVAIGGLNEQVEPELLDCDPAQRVAALIYTTGTTGRPKGVMLTNGNLLYVARESSAVRGLGPQDCIYAVLPISHILGLTGILISALVSGSKVHLSSRFDPSGAVSALTEGDVSVMIGTPSMYGMLSDYLSRHGRIPLRSPQLRLISSAGAPLDAATKAGAEAAFGLPLHNGYGITETSPTLTLTRLNAPRSDCSVGMLLPGIEAVLRGSDGAQVTAGETGELFIRGPGVMKGYYRSDAETTEAIDSGGWFRSGDLGRFDGEHLFIVGRAKEMIIRFGFNVYPAEIEAVLNAVPGVARSAVVGRPAVGGEEIVAFVQISPGSTLGTAEIAACAAKELAPYKRPTAILVLPMLPASPTGKILKSELSAMAATTRVSA